MELRGGRARTLAAIVAAVGWAAGAGAGAEVPPCHAPPAATAPAGEVPGAEARVALVDAPLVDRDGRAVRFASDVVGDRIVAVNFVYTTCTTVCPVLSGLFTSLQDRLGAKLDGSVRLVSLSLDPARDTPARLAAMAERHHAGPGWRWLTGEREQVERVLRGLGAYVPRPADHAPSVLVGDPRSGRWYRLNGFPSPEALAARVEELLAARTAGAEDAR